MENKSATNIFYINTMQKDDKKRFSLFIWTLFKNFRVNYFVKINDDFFSYKLERSKKKKNIPWAHLINIEIKEKSIIFTFKNKGKKEVVLDIFTINEIDKIKEVTVNMWEKIKG